MFIILYMIQIKVAKS